MKRLLALAFLLTACEAGAPRTPPLEIATGVSRALAEHRARTIRDVRYDLSFTIPSSIEQRIAGHASIRLDLRDTTRPLVLDFTAPAGSVGAVHLNGGRVAAELTDGHIVIPAGSLRRGATVLDVDFLAGDLSLNRNPDYLYTLFVPDRASSAFPAFDQPDLKARFRLTLHTPATWVAAANGPLATRDTARGMARWEFRPTAPISTYLFSFAAGEFATETRDRRGRALTLYHRETDTAKVAQNLDAIFELHRLALDWLEAYTGIPYPFEQFAFVAVPAFQYGGMEHPGAVLYRASRLFLDSSATRTQLLGRASLIAHETAHMWFGDLVTMEWFDDVWMKEVFANFMAAKIVNPAFPDIDHDLRFFLAHHPSAYDVDRTPGANPIRQELDNLKDAGTLYGAIIYQKAPIVMRHLEQLVGERSFRDGLREYLERHQYGNASWHDLIAVLDRRTPIDLAAWSSVWVEQPGRPIIAVRRAGDDAATALISQEDPFKRGLVWNQRLAIATGYPDTTIVVTIDAADRVQRVPLPRPDPAFLLPGAAGLGYGRFVLDSVSRSYLLRDLATVPSPLHRSVAWVTLWDALLDGAVASDALADLALRALPRETDELNVQRILGYLTGTYWRFLTPEQRAQLAPRVDAVLWAGVQHGASRSLKAAYFDAYVDLLPTRPAVDRVRRLWGQHTTIPDLPLAERHFTRMAYELALREEPGWPTLLDEQAARIDNPDRRAEFAFVRQALAAGQSTRDSFFLSLRDPRNREHEPWVIEALRYLHHPLRAASSERYIRPSLELLEEIQTTGDIFFPQRWLGATFSGHSSPRAAGIVRQFLDERPNYPPRLRAKILQEADELFRAARPRTQPPVAIAREDRERVGQ